MKLKQTWRKILMNRIIHDNNWQIEDGAEKDVVLSSRVRLARNLQDFHFPNQASLTEKNKIIDKLLSSLDFIDEKNYHFFNMDSLNILERNILQEKNLISTEHARKTNGRALLINNNLNISIMINEEDHLRIQAFGAGLEFQKIWERADEIDDLIESKVDYSFSDKWGYLTACPTNVGTALRASAMCHLPGLVITGRIDDILGAVGKFGLTVRGVYGEGSGSIGELFQISNQITLGYSEEEIIDNLESIIYQIIEEERKSRNYLLEHDFNKIKDSVMRSLGILKYAYTIEEKEALKYLSRVKLGYALGLIEEKLDNNFFGDLLFKIRKAHLQIDEFTEKDKLDIKRAEIIQTRLLNKE
jgi:protein arginine kinase